MKKKLIGIILVLTLVAICFAGCGEKEKKEGDTWPYDNIPTRSLFMTQTGYTEENTTSSFTFDFLRENLKEVNFVLTWVDTNSQPPGNGTRVKVNPVEEPDTFELSVFDMLKGTVYYLPSGTINETSFYGTIKIRALMGRDSMIITTRTMWSFIVRITCIDAPGHGAGGFMPPVQDMGNDWELQIERVYFNTTR